MWPTKTVLTIIVFETLIHSLRSQFNWILRLVFCIISSYHNIGFQVMFFLEGYLPALGEFVSPVLHSSFPVNFTLLFYIYSTIFSIWLSCFVALFFLMHYSPVILSLYGPKIILSIFISKIRKKFKGFQTPYSSYQGIV